MSQSAKAQEPSMEEILASIRRIIADEDPAKPPAKPASGAPPAAPRMPLAAPLAPPSQPSKAAARPAPAPSMKQTDVDAMLAGLDAPPGGDAAAKDDVLDLTESMAEPRSGAPGFKTIDGQPDVVFSDDPAVPEPRAADNSRRPAAPGASGLLSSSATDAVNSAFNTLAHTVLVQNARTLEDLVREMLRPMLKAWLDDNLPGMVERIIKSEIERVSRGRM